jgi:hypothetical protein
LRAGGRERLADQSRQLSVEVDAVLTVVRRGAEDGRGCGVAVDEQHVDVVVGVRRGVLHREAVAHPEHAVAVGEGTARRGEWEGLVRQ